MKREDIVTVLDNKVKSFIDDFKNGYKDNLENQATLDNSLISMSITLKSLKDFDETPVVVEKPTEEGLKQFIGNILHSARYDHAKPGYTLYDYAIEYIKTGVIPDKPEK